MRIRSMFLFSCLAMLYFAATLWSQQNQVSSTASTAAASPVPRLIKFSGTLLDEQGRPMKSPVGVTFALYAQQSEGAALWMETQNVEVDAEGNYTVLLGANSGSGVPAELFTTGEARWLGVQAERQLEQPRVLLVSVPYALKAGDAQTLGGLPPSAFAPASINAAANPASPSSASGILLATLSGQPEAASNAGTAAPTGGGTTNFIPLWTSSTNLGNSILFQSTSSNVNVNGSLSLPALKTATALAGANSQPLDLLGSSFSSSTHAAVSQHFRWQAEPVANNTVTPSGKLNLLYAAGTAAPAETGFSIDNKGVMTFAPGQTFPDLGDVKSVGLAAPATDFTVSGSPVTSSGTLKFAWNVVPTNLNTANAIVKRDASGNFSAGAGAFSGNLSSGGIVSGAAGSFAGNLAVGGSVAGSAGSFIGTSSTGPIVNVEQFGTNNGMNVTTRAPFFAALNGENLGTGNFTIGILGQALFPNGTSAGAPTETGSIGVNGIGPVAVQGVSSTAQGIAGQFISADGKAKMLSGFNNTGGTTGGEFFSVDGNGVVHARAFQDLAGNPVGGNVTQILYAEPASATSSITPTLLRTLGTFNKVAAETAVTTTWISHVRGAAGNGSDFCQFEVRIDNTVPTGQTPGLDGAVTYGQFEAVNLIGRWTGLAPGLHTVSIWLRGVGSTCSENSGNFERLLYVNEV